MIVYWKLSGSLSICLRSPITGSLSIGTGNTRDSTTTPREAKMRKKKFKYTDLSDKHFCRKCGKRIKKQLVLIKDLPPKLCYKHWLEQKGKHRHSEGDFAPVDIYRRKP